METAGAMKMVKVFALEHIAEKPVFQNSINYDDTILNCNLLDIINVNGELEIILEGNENNSDTNTDTPKINCNMHSAKDKTAKNDSQIFESKSNNFSSESHSESHRFDSRPTPHGFDNNSRNQISQIIEHWLMLYRILVVETLIIKCLLIFRRTLWFYF